VLLDAAGEYWEALGSGVWGEVPAEVEFGALSQNLTSGGNNFAILLRIN